jgi:hypothetical protein
MSLAVRGGSIRRAVDGWLDAADRKRIRIADIGSAKARTAFVRAGLGWSSGGRAPRPAPARSAAVSRSRPGLVRRPGDSARHRRRPRRFLEPRRRSGRCRFLARLLAQGLSFDSGHNIHAVGGSSVRFVVATAL